MVGNVSANSSTNSNVIPNLEHPTPTARIVTGVILFAIGIIGGFGNSRIIFVFTKTPTLSNKTTRLILATLAVVDLTGCLINIPLPFSAIVLQPPGAELYYLSYAHILFTYFILWCSYFCFLLISIDMNDTLRKMFRRRTLLTAQRVKIVLVAMVVSAFVLAFFMYFFHADNPFFPQKTEQSNTKFHLMVYLRIALFSTGMLSLLSLVHSFLRVQAMLKRLNRIMSEQHGLDRRTEQMKQKKLLRTVIEMFVCFVVVYIPFFVVSVLQEQGMLNSVDPFSLAVTRAVFLMTYATNSLVCGWNLHVLFASFSSLCHTRLINEEVFLQGD